MAVDAELGFEVGTGEEARVELDPADRVLRWSREAERLIAIRAAHARGRRLFELIEARDGWGNRVCACGLHEALRRGEPVRTFVIDARAGTGQPIRLVVRPELPARGSAAGAALVVGLRRDLRRASDRRRPVRSAERAAVVHDPTAAAAPLTRREQEVLRLLAAGVSTAAIAQKLGISPVTVRNHVQRLLDRLGAHSRLAAVALAHARGWID